MAAVRVIENELDLPISPLMNTARDNEGFSHSSHTWMYAVQLSQASQVLIKQNTPSLSVCEMSTHLPLS